jgi:glucosylceramidase
MRYLGFVFTLFCLLLAACSAPTADLPTATVTPPSPTATPVQSVPVQVWLTTADQSKLLELQPELTFEQQPLESANIIHVNENSHYQQMDGFGASMTDSSAWLIYTQLSETQRANVMSALFSPNEGIGVSVTRIPMGASDFVHGDPYTYNDMPAGQTDPHLAHFSIEHDRAYIIPALRDALKINPELKVMASPWSPPAWMKNSETLGHGKLLPEYYSVYADYFVRFIQDYQAENIPIYAITLQNEPYHEPYSYPGMRMEPGEAAEFVKNHLGPAFEAAGLDTKIIIWDHNWDKPQYPITVLNDPQAKAYIAGSAFHCYDGTVIAQGLVHEAHPDRDIYFTECSGGAWIPSFGEGLKRDLKDLVMGSTRNWAKTVIKWNLALDTSYGPHNGGCGNCYGFVTIDPESESGLTFNADYFSIGHLSKFVPPGAYRIASTSYLYEGLESVAFLNPDGSKVLVVSNIRDKDKAFAVRWGSQYLAYTLPSESVATFTWDGVQQNLKIPAYPTELRVRSSAAGGLVISWEFSALADSYNIKRSTEPGGPYTLIATGIEMPEYVDTQAKPGIDYFYVVSAVNGLGESLDSSEMNLVP